MSAFFFSLKILSIETVSIESPKNELTGNEWQKKNILFVNQFHMKMAQSSLLKYRKVGGKFHSNLLFKSYVVSAFRFTSVS